MEAIIVLVGFLGAGKTTLLRKLLEQLLAEKWDAKVILNDYENAAMDAQRFQDIIASTNIEGMSGSCICCSGLTELRNSLNDTQARKNGVTLIEANGTTDACSLMEFLGVGLKEHFLPPVQISVVNASLWQKRAEHNELEKNQIQVSSLVVLTHLEGLSEQRLDEVKSSIHEANAFAKIISFEDFHYEEALNLPRNSSDYEKLEHKKAHWASCSIDLPEPMSSVDLQTLLEKLPEGIVRVKGATKLDEDNYYSYFEKTPSNEAKVRPFHGKLISGPKLLLIGPGSDPDRIRALLSETLAK